MAHPPSPEQRIDAPVLTALSGSTPGHGESRLRMALRHSLPVMGVVVVVVLVAVIAYYVYDSNRRGAVALSNDLVTAIDRRGPAQPPAFPGPPPPIPRPAGDPPARPPAFAGRSGGGPCRSPSPWRL